MKTIIRIFLTFFCAALMLWISEARFFGTNGANKMRALRNGEVVTITPGIQARLNLKNKTYETSDGKKFYVGNDENFFPLSEAKRLALEKMEFFKSNHPITYQIQKTYKENTFIFWVIFGGLFVIYLFWKLLKFIIREIFFTATKAIEDAKNRNY